MLGVAAGCEPQTLRLGVKSHPNEPFWVTSLSHYVELIEHANWSEVVLNHPDTRNAITGPLGEELACAIKEVDRDTSSRVLLLRGAGGAFCSGLNLKEFNRDPPPAWLSGFQSTWRAVHTALYELRKPVVVGLERFAINGGAALALAADLLIVGEDSFLQVGEVRQGMAAPYNMAWLRLRHSEATIAQLTLTGRRFNGEELFRLGVAYAVPSTADVLAAATELCEELANYPEGGLASIKSTMRAYHKPSADQWFDVATGARSPRRGKIPKVS